MKYLDLTGLTVYTDKVRELLNDKANNNIVYDICNELSRISTLKKEILYFTVIGTTTTSTTYMINDEIKSIDIIENEPINVYVPETIYKISFNSLEYNTYSIRSIDLSKLDFSNVTSLSKMFYHHVWSLESVNMANIDVSNVTDLSAMFYYCENLKEVNMSGWNTTSVQKLSYWDNTGGYSYGTFTKCNNLEYLDLSSWDLSNVSDDWKDYSEFIIGNEDNRLTCIKCKLVFKDWCLAHPMSIPSAFMEGGSGVWDIVD